MFWLFEQLRRPLCPWSSESLKNKMIRFQYTPFNKLLAMNHPVSITWSICSDLSHLRCHPAEQSWRLPASAPGGEAHPAVAGRSPKFAALGGGPGPPLWKIWVRQFWDDDSNPILMGKCQKCAKPPGARRVIPSCFDSTTLFDLFGDPKNHPQFEASKKMKKIIKFVKSAKKKCQGKKLWAKIACPLNDPATHTQIHLCGPLQLAFLSVCPWNCYMSQLSSWVSPWLFPSDRRTWPCSMES